METSAADAAESRRAPDRFTAHRGLLVAVAYRMLGSVADAEDIAQEAWLRWAGADTAAIRDARAWLVKTTTRLAIDRLRRVQARREVYVGPWLPEPILTGGDVADDVGRADTLSIAMLRVLESLSPLERAVFVLREAFDFSHADIADFLGRSEVSVRQVASRARAHVEKRAPRYDTDPRTGRTVTEAFLHACVTGDLTGLLGVLAPGVTLVSDSGGVGRAPKRVMSGADKIARFFLAVAAEPLADMAVSVVEVNGQTGVVAWSGGSPAYATVIDVVDGRAANINLMANPSKLAGLRLPAGR